jgi:hypothetical protein
MRDLDQHLPFARCRLLAERLAYEQGRTVTVRTLPADMALDRDGANRNGVVYFHRDGAPAHVVAHEVAHALGNPGEDEHGSVWRARWETLSTRLQTFL